MNNFPKITIVIPSFNKIKYIDITLDSIFSQKYSNLEVIIQDGGSTDGTVEVVKKFTKKYPKNIIWESKKDGGQMDAVNKGMKKATGEIVTFINADDSYEPGAFNLVSKAYKNNPDALWYAGRGTIVNEEGRGIAKPVTIYKNLLLSCNTYYLLLTTNHLTQPSVFINRNAYKKYGPFTGTKDFIMEYDMWLKLGKIRMPIVINQYLSNFRIEASTKTKTMFDQILKEDEIIVRKYTGNTLILLLHSLNNLGRKILGRFV